MAGRLSVAIHDFRCSLRCRLSMSTGRQLLWRRCHLASAKARGLKPIPVLYRTTRIIVLEEAEEDAQ